MDKAKHTLVQFWLRKAQRDLTAAQKLAQELPDIAIYHCQQAAEKALRHLPVIKCPALLQRITFCTDKSTTKAGHFIFWISLKGFLVFHDTEPGDTHNINTLVRLASTFKPEFLSVLKEAGYLSQYNQIYRYPMEATEDFNPSVGELKKAYKLASDVYKNVIDSMPASLSGKSPE